MSPRNNIDGGQHEALKPLVTGGGCPLTPAADLVTFVLALAIFVAVPVWLVIA